MGPLNLEHIRLASGRVSRSIELTMDLRFNGCPSLGGILQGQARALPASVLGAARLNMGLHDDVSLEPPPASGEQKLTVIGCGSDTSAATFFCAPKYFEQHESLASGARVSH